MRTGEQEGTGRPLDLSGLDGRVTLRDVREFSRLDEAPRAGRQWWVIALIVAVFLVTMAVFVGVMLPVTGLDAELRRGVYAGFLVFIGLYATVLMGMIWNNAARPVRIDRAARANGLIYEDRQSPRVRLAGSVYGHSSFRFVTDVLRAGTGPQQTFAAATIGPRPGARLRRSGVAVITLERPTPHIVLQNRRTGILRTLGIRFHANQRLSLEGDFDRTFTLYCPRGYETDALYIFTPDLMALLIDLAGDCEVELLGQDLILYSRRPWRLWQPRRFAALVALVTVIGAKARRQTQRYEDVRRDVDQAIAAPGRRLRARPSLGAVLATAAPIAVMAVGVVSWFAS